MLPSIKLLFEPRDIWVGVYWNKVVNVTYPASKLDIYICVVPCFPIHLHWGWGFWSDKAQ